VYIPIEDVEQVICGIKENLVPSRAEFNDLEKQVRAVEDRLQSIQGSFGFGAPRTRRTDDELLLMYAEHRRELKQASWSKPRMLELAREIISLREDELEFLYREKGERGWVPTFQLLRLMRRAIEKNRDFPGSGLDVLHTKIDQAIQRFYSLVYMSTKTETEFNRKHARMTLKALNLQPGALDQFIARGIAREITQNQ
jgi:hypothetical protein